LYIIKCKIIKLRGGPTDFEVQAQLEEVFWGMALEG